MFDQPYIRSTDGPRMIPVSGYVIWGTDFKAKAEKERETALTGNPCVDDPENCSCETLVYRPSDFVADEKDPA